MSKAAKKFTRLKTDAVIGVPEDVAVCPRCGGKLYITCDHWEQCAEDKGWIAASINMDCETEPEILTDDWMEWLNGHYSQPYIDWLPVEHKLVVWLNKNYRWELQ